MKLGAREYVFLWSVALERGCDWPALLNRVVYNAHTDYVAGWGPARSINIKVSREGSASCDILKKHGLTQDQIDEAVKKYLEEP